MHTSYYMLVIAVLNLATCRTREVYSNTWVAKVDGGLREAERIAREKDLTLLGQVGSLEGFYLFKHNSHPKRSKRDAMDITSDLGEHPNVIWADQQIVKRRVRRDYNPKLNDPDYSKQWFLHNRDSIFRGYDHNVLPVWEQGVTGKGIVVSILDDGIEYKHGDLKDNYDSEASYDYNSNDPDPAPRPTWNDENRHGTRCAGEVAAAWNNSVCGVGVAPGSKVGGVRMLDGDVTDAVEASSLSLNPQHIDLYSSSWGPDDDGRTVDGPATLAKKAFADGVQKGRGGLGSIFVWASGNGGRGHDSCSCDGYTNSIYTLSISSATEHGTSPWYSEYCASTLATTFSSGSYDMRKIVTTDLHGRCTDSHTGTSASAPLAAGILALAMEVNRNLTWRDMQHLVVRTSSNAKLKSDDFVVNAVGRKVSHKFGYGLLDALALVNLARKWKTTPAQHVCREIPEAQQRPIPGTGSLKVTIDATACSGNDRYVRYLEHVQVVITLTFTRRGDLTIKLISPRGTASVLLPQRREDYSGSGFTDWEFMSTHTWGEDPKGTWTLEIENHGASRNSGTLKNWYLITYGTSEPPQPTDSTKEPVAACNLECQNGCTGPRANQCKECKHFRRSTSNECVADCTKTEYRDLAAKLCAPCSPTCATCYGPNSPNCLSCYPPLILNNGSCVNFCPDGWYKHVNGSILMCGKCDKSCLTCAGNATSCTSCRSQYRHHFSRCVAKCADGQYLAEDGQCKICHPSCRKCHAGGASSCTECGTKETQQQLFLHGGECKASCPSGFYGDRESQECKPCSASCSSCVGSSASDCLSCSKGHFRTGTPVGTCVESCPEGQYGESSNGTCVACLSSCKHCDAIEPTKCTSCQEGKFLHVHQCLSAEHCPTGTFPNSTSSICENCQVGCASCSHSSSLECQSCSEGFVKYKSQCLIRCPEGTFPRNSSCVPCNSACRTCFGEESNHCFSCSPSNVLAGSTCVTKCPDGTFHSQNPPTCKSCHTNCETCRGPSASDCQTCRAGWSLDGSECKPVCPRGKFNSSDGCQRCHPVCHSCTGPDEKDCLSCSDIKFLDLQTKQCSYECPDGYFGELDTTRCKPCSPGCTKCKNEVECLSCQPGLLFVANSCRTQCPAGQYRSKTNSCEPCDGMCKECVRSSNNCVRCKEHEVLNNGICVSICPIGTYLLPGTKSCAPCHSSCKSCTGPGADQCTRCHPASVMANSRCLASCPSDYYFDREVNSCQRCDYYCSTCEGGNGLRNCTRCIPPFVLYKHYCIRECPKHGWVLDTSRQKCIKCHPSCSRCIGPTANDCIACSKPDTSLVGFSCKKECPHGTFPNRDTGLCEKCHPTCQTCSGAGADTCLSCAKDLVQSQDKGTCGSVCPEGKFSLEGKCEKCHPNCRSCNGPDSFNCLSCSQGKVFYNFTCVSSCPSGSFLTEQYGIHQCQTCHPVCQSCYGFSSDNCRLCKSPLYLERGMCVVQCSPNHSIEEQTRSCHPCGRECKSSVIDRNRSVQYPNDSALKFVLVDPGKTGLSAIAIVAMSLAIVTFLVVFGILQFRSKKRMKYYTSVECNGRAESDDECNWSLIEDEDEDERM